MAARPRLQDRLFTALTTLGALVVLVVGLSRGNTKVAVFGALFFLGYGVLHSVTRRLTPAARLVTGSEADHAERMAQFRATRLAGQAALIIAAVGVALELALQWEPGLWVAGTALLVVAAFVAGLWIFSRGTARERRGRARGDAARDGRARGDAARDRRARDGGALGATPRDGRAPGAAARGDASRATGTNRPAG